MNEYLEKEIDSCINKVNFVRNKRKDLSDEFINNSSVEIIEHLKYATEFEEVRSSSIKQIESLKGLPYIEEEKKWHIIFNNQKIHFKHMRLNVVGGYLTTVWGGIYDNIGIAINTLYNAKLEEIKTQGNNKKHDNSNFYSVFLKKDYGVLRPVGLLRQKYGEYVSIYYEIRNMFIHGHTELFKGFFLDDSSTHTSFILKENKLKDLRNNASKRNKNRSPKKPDPIDDNKNDISIPHDLVNAIEMLEDMVDKCVADLLYYASHNLDLTRFPEHL